MDILKDLLSGSTIGWLIFAISLVVVIGLLIVLFKKGGVIEGFGIRIKILP